jgi:hypothetical protein
VTRNVDSRQASNRNFNLQQYEIHWHVHFRKMFGTSMGMNLRYPRYWPGEVIRSRQEKLGHVLVHVNFAITARRTTIEKKRKPLGRVGGPVRRPHAFGGRRHQSTPVLDTFTFTRLR